MIYLKSKMTKGRKEKFSSHSMIRNERKGFTLIEILIVVAIIAILASVVLVGLGPTQQAGRDARRISDLREVQNGLELYFNRCGFYPGQAAPASGACTFTAAPADWAALTTVLTTSGIGVTNVPNDPNTNQSYVYGSTDGSGYVMGAKLENAANSALTTSVHGTVQGVNCATPEYCVQL